MVAHGVYGVPAGSEGQVLSVRSLFMGGCHAAVMLAAFSVVLLYSPPLTMIWYGFCTYWTDDWDELSTVPQEDDVGAPEIPCCPECGSVGFEIEDDEWWEGVQRVEQDQRGYYSFIKALREHCHGKGISIGDLWEEYKKEGASGK